MEFLTAFTIHVPAGTPARTVDELDEREAKRAHEHSEQGHLVRLWSAPAEPGGRRTLGLWRARDAAGMQAILESLPMYVWMTIETTALTRHPNDPAVTQT